MKKKLYLSSLLLICLSLCSLGAKAQAPVITLDPRDTTGCAMNFIPFVTNATGTGVSYYWLESTDAGATWDTVHNGVTYIGATTNTLGVLAIPPFSGFLYKAVAINGSGADTSLPATLTVEEPITTLPGITGASNICVGQTITLGNAVPGGVWSHVNHVADTLVLATLELTGLAPGYDTVTYTVSNVCNSMSTSAPIRVDATVSALPITGPTATCVGNVITLMNANVDGTGTWTSGNTAVGTISGTTGSATLTAISAGVTVVTYTFVNACTTVTSTVSVTVQAPLTPPTISGPDAVCVGSWINLTSVPTGGIWISSNTAIAVVDMSGNVTGIAQGTAVISYLLSNACGSVMATDTVTVFAPAAAITGGDSVGIGNTLTLSNATAGGVWSSLDASIATVGSTGIVTGVATGTTIIFYAVTNLCGSSSSSIIMNVGPAPSAGTISGSNPDSVCVGGSKTFTSTIAGGVWSTVNGHATVNPTTGVTTGVTFGVDTLQYTVSNAFGSTTARRRLYVNWAHVDSVKGPILVSTGGDYDIIGYPAGGIWTVTGHGTVELINNASTGHIVVMKAGKDTLIYTVTNTCGTDTMHLPIQLTTAGVNTIAEAGFLNIYPNPATEAISLNLETAMSQEATVTITNMIGEKVKELTVKTNNATEIRLDQPAGIYFVTAKTATGTYTAKVTIAK